MTDATFSNDANFKRKLTSEQATASDLKRYLILVFGTYKTASQVAGMSESRLHQLFMGYKIPKNPRIIKRLSDAWNVDIVVITKIFDKLQESYTPQGEENV